MSFISRKLDSIMHKVLNIILLICIILLSGCEQRKATVEPSGRVVKIGVIAPLSGPDKKSGDNALLGIKTALQMQPLLKNGDRVELIVEDNKGNPQQTLVVLDKLHAQDDVAAVLLMAKSDVVLAVVPKADQYRIPVLALTATHPDITKDNNFIAQLGFDDIFQGTIAALYVRDEMLINRVAVFSDPGDAHYTFLANEFIRKFSSAGGEVIEHVTSSPGPEDQQKILQELQGKNIRLLYLAVPPERVVQLAREAKKIGWNPEMMGGDGLLTSMVLQHMEDRWLFEGMIATDFYSTLSKTEYGNRASRIFNKQFSEPGTSYTGLGCEGTSILLHAMDQCNEATDRSCINQRLRQTREFEGLFGKISIHENGKTERPIFVNVIEGQKMKFLVKVY